MPGFELIGAEERNAVNEVFEDGGILFAHGFDKMRNGRYRVREFERAFAQRMGVQYAQAVSSGTAALTVALVALGVKPGDEVITQAFTFVATVEAIVAAGAVPIIVGVDETLNMDPAQFEAAITRRTRVVLPVHMLGLAGEMDAILEIAQSHGISVLEDNCQSIGAAWNHKMLGTLGDVGAFSFDFGKTITTGEGGMVATNCERIFKLAREYHDHGHENNPSLPRGRDTRRICGFNFRMTELQAAVGLAQLPKLDWILERNRASYSILEKMLAEIAGLKLRKSPAQCSPVHDCLVVEMPTIELAVAFAQRMLQKGLPTKNLPDAFEWHFAGFWDHIFGRYGLSKETLWAHVRLSYDRLARCVAVPIMVKYTAERAEQIGENLCKIARDLLG